MGGRDRRSLRQHRRDPTTRLTPPSAHDITTRRTAARQRQPAQNRTRAPSSTHPTQRCRRRHRHERPGLIAATYSLDRLSRVVPQIMADLHDAGVIIYTADREPQPLGDTTTLLDIQIATIHASSSRVRRIKH